MLQEINKILIAVSHCFLFYAAANILVFISFTQGEELWTLRSPIPMGVIRGIAYGDGQYATAGYGGRVFSSSDGDNWVLRRPADDIEGQELTAIAWGNNRFIAISRLVDSLYSSTDGKSWVTSVTGDEMQFYAIAFCNNRFIAVGGHAFSSSQQKDVEILTSPEGAIWTRQTFNDAKVNLYNTPYGIAYGNGKFIIVGEKGCVFSSAVGAQWLLNKPSEVANYDFISLVWDGSAFVAVADSETAPGALFQSVDGTSWKKIGILAASTKTIGHVSNLAFGNGAYVVSGNKGLLQTSRDCINWTSTSPDVSFWYPALLWDGKQFFIGTDVGRIYSSMNGTDWTQRSKGDVSDLNSVFWSGSKFIASGRYGTSISTDGITWEEHKDVKNKINIWKIAYNGERFVAIADSSPSYYKNLIITSSDAVTWTSSFHCSSKTRLNDIIFVNNQFIAVGDSFDLQGKQHGKILTSQDGIAWTDRASGTENWLNAIAYGNGKYVAVGYQGTILYSTDAATWSACSSMTNDIYSITYGQNKFIATSTNDTCNLVSSDGISWTRKGNSVLNKRAICYGDSQFVIVGDNGMIISSSDGETWEMNNSEVGNNKNGPILLSVAFGRHKFVAIGMNGIILTSPSTSAVNQFKNYAQFEERQLSFRRKMIHYYVSSSGPVALKIFDLRGSLTKSFVNTYQQTGAYSVSIPASLVQGRYIVSLRTGKEIVNKQMVVAR